ncbi:hypothetical protein Hanom_Chr05g00447861 [Helianthus anomalus]
MYFKSNKNDPLWSRKFFEQHGLHLIGTTTTWFLLDIACAEKNTKCCSFLSMD